MILESGMNFFDSDDMTFDLSTLTTTEKDIGVEIDLNSEKPFAVARTQAEAYAYLMGNKALAFTGTTPGISLWISSKAVGGTYSANHKVNVANIDLSTLSSGDDLFRIVLPRNTLQIIKLSAKLTGTTPAITSGKIFGNVTPRID